MIEYLLDANIILRFLRDDDAEQSPRARTLFAQAASGKCVLILPHVVLAECVWVLRSHYRTEPEPIASVLSSLITKPGVITDEPELAMETLLRMAKSKADFVDCYLSARAVMNHQTVASFDRGFRKFGDVLRWKPGSL